MRITIDIDNESQLGILKTYFNMKHILGRKVFVRKTGRGYHFIAYGLPVTQEEAIHIRFILGDDLARIKFDERSDKKPKQVLFRKKKYRNSSHEVIEQDNPDFLSLPFCSRIPRGYYVKNRNAYK